MDADKKFVTLGNKAQFGFQLRLNPGQTCEFEPERSVSSWGEWRLWVANVNLCALQFETQAGTVEVQEIRWFLPPLFRWIVDNWMPLLHEKRLPPGGRIGDSRPRSARTAYLASVCQKTPLRHEICDEPPHFQRGFGHGTGRTDTTEGCLASNRPEFPTSGHRRPFPSPCAGPGGGEVRRRWPRSGSAASSTSFGLTHAPSHK